MENFLEIFVSSVGVSLILHFGFFKKSDPEFGFWRCYAGVFTGMTLAYFLGL